MSTTFNPYWLEPGAAVPVDIATTAALVTEIQRLRQALAQPEQKQYVTKVVAMHEDGTYTTESMPLPKRECAAAIRARGSNGS